MSVGQTRFRFSRGNTREATVVIAALNSTALSKTKADYVCAGSDDQDPINTAISSLPSGGGSVLLMEGTYVIGGAILLPDNIEFSGLGISTILQLAPNQPNLQAIIENSDPASGNEFISIRNLMMDGNQANQTPGDQHYGISMENVSNILIEGCHLKNMTGPAIYFVTTVAGGPSCDLVTITNNHFSDNLYEGILFSTTAADPADHLTLTQNTFGGVSGRTCIDLTTITNSVISHNNVNNSAIHGIQIGGVGGALYSTVSHNNCSDCTEVGLWLVGAQYTSILGNVCRGNGSYGIHLSTFMGPTTLYNTIQGNVAYNNGEEGFSLNTARSTIIGNIAYENSRDSDNTDDNILVAGDYNTIQGNSVHQSANDKCRYGLRIDSGTDNIVTGNQCDNGGGDAAGDDYSDNGTTTVNANNNTR